MHSGWANLLRTFQRTGPKLCVCVCVSCLAGILQLPTEVRTALNANLHPVRPGTWNSFSSSDLGMAPLQGQQSQKAAHLEAERQLRLSVATGMPQSFQALSLTFWTQVCSVAPPQRESKTGARRQPAVNGGGGQLLFAGVGWQGGEARAEPRFSWRCQQALPPG